MERYNTVRWADVSSRDSLIHTIAQPEDVKTRLGRAVVAAKVTVSSRVPGTTPAIIREYLPKYARDPTAWWNDQFIHVALEAVGTHTDQENQQPRGHLAFLHVSFDSNGAPCTFHEDTTGERRPWTCLPRDWLSKTTAGVISSSDNTHFIAVAIFGPQKLVVVYDGAAGLYDSPGLWEVRAEQSPDPI